MYHLIYRWFLDTMEKKSSKAYILNGLVLTAVFFACRILTMPSCWYMIYTVYGTEPFTRTGGIKYVLIISCGALDSLNVFWFYKLCKGAHKTLQKLDANMNKSEWVSALFFSFIFFFGHDFVIWFKTCEWF